MTNTKSECVHLGNGLYADFDGYAIVLKANDHDCLTDKVYLTPKTFSALKAYAEKVWGEQK